MTMSGSSGSRRSTGQITERVCGGRRSAMGHCSSCAKVPPTSRVALDRVRDHAAPR